ncbi:MAG: ribose-phosphate pyrophosphokinase [Bacteroidetes bacterium]|jgi:ribose-phosphate pyrophosphokinase|nr:ribose-phosphate pyrophosphokinase [Bacteroidota bacterium]MBL0018667.1 ribose-phosphate pyrophosphokinase [Bacteroidota bacterium]MBP6639427.1 ribose-phosphate pyrophosphokinase [Bacteroidia bacterium]MBP6721057.1 ribose-phosphate pyrophosphokinase [Bacteroidia bacterium]MBP8073429.1 ribose-phosphate pyrophosphokinase [Bacteroidia bacterium]
MASEVKIFSGTASKYLAEEIAGQLGKQLGAVTVTRFQDGELEPSYNESVRGDVIFLIQSTFGQAENLMELLLMIDAARRASAKSIIVVMPYYGYARQDRKDKPRVSIGAKLVANLLTTAGADRIVTMDLHAGQIQGFFDIPLDHLYSIGVFFPYLENLGLENVAIAAPDAGGAKRAREYASFMKCDLILIDKFRERANEVASMKVIGEVKGKNVLIIDDLVDTAGTLCKAADHLMMEGAASVRAVVTHPILSGPAYERIEESSLTELITTNTIPLRGTSSKIKVLSVAPMLARAFEKITNYESISSLYKQ